MASFCVGIGAVSTGDSVRGDELGFTWMHRINRMMWMVSARITMNDEKATPGEGRS